jgi:HTH-type transcriptional regulator/antitoxin HipB
MLIRKTDRLNVRQLITNPSQVGEIIRGRRKSRGISQQDLAAQLQVSQSGLSTIEGDAAGLTLERLLVVANVLGLELILQDKSARAKPPAEW